MLKRISNFFHSFGNSILLFSKNLSICYSLKNNKTILSPHTAALTEECRKRMGVEAVQNLIDFFDEKLEKSKIVKL